MYAEAMPVAVTVSQARSTLSDIIERVLVGEEVTLTRHGVAVAVIVRPDALKFRRADASLVVAAEIHELIEQGRTVAMPSGAGITSKRAEALITEVRHSRARR